MAVLPDCWAGSGMCCNIRSFLYIFGQILSNYWASKTSEKYGNPGAGLFNSVWYYGKLFPSDVRILHDRRQNIYIMPYISKTTPH